MMTSKSSSKGSRSAVCLGLVLGVLLSGGPARANELFKQHYNRARTLYKSKNYYEAIPEFIEAYRIRQLPTILFNVGQAYYKIGNCANAVLYYDKYLKIKIEIPPEDRAEAIRYKNSCQEALSVAEQAEGARGGSAGTLGRQVASPDIGLGRSEFVPDPTSAPASSIDRISSRLPDSREKPLAIGTPSAATPRSEESVSSTARPLTNPDLETKLPPQSLSQLVVPTSTQARDNLASPALPPKWQPPKTAWIGVALTGAFVATFATTGGLALARSRELQSITPPFTFEVESLQSNISGLRLTTDVLIGCAGAALVSTTIAVLVHRARFNAGGAERHAGRLTLGGTGAVLHF